MEKKETEKNPVIQGEGVHDMKASLYLGNRTDTLKKNEGSEGQKSLPITRRYGDSRNTENTESASLLLS